MGWIKSAFTAAKNLFKPQYADDVIRGMSQAGKASDPAKAVVDMSLRELGAAGKEVAYAGAKKAVPLVVGGAALKGAYEVGQAHPDKKDPGVVDQVAGGFKSIVGTNAKGEVDGSKLSGIGAILFAALAAGATFLFGGGAAMVAGAGLVAAAIGAVAGKPALEKSQEALSTLQTPPTPAQAKDKDKPASTKQNVAAAGQQEVVDIEVPKGLPSQASASGGKQNPAGRTA